MHRICKAYFYKTKCKCPIFHYLSNPLYKAAIYSVAGAMGCKLKRHNDQFLIYLAEVYSVAGAKGCKLKSHND